ncbi:TAXI family TRAP transporter solute-binding subunit [Halobacteria archaeon AArc-m2/3/4]|uniref:TAXI family TRAP transporter solute-binding subunit n=1 Tax=Natronoglomus mannanivorans TaxID=2979990 RepID=A0AAP3E184_9EURY|nr:TAXI family TRAP transporter solute-binding subunit [Halobacteria archaeon AArc-xg1-1]MCU4972371.1 TAXI family TRAP transporter solute-binding subunit [Halobacteria archaeon AArc-m2/3/4]
MVQKIDRRRFVTLTGIAGVAGLTGTVSARQDDDGEEIDEDADPDEGGEILSWHAGGTGGTYYPLSGEFKTIVEDNTPHGLQVQSTGASVENVGSLAREEAEFALIQNDVAYFAYHGTGLQEFEDMPIENLRGVATLYPETIHILVDAGSDIDSIEDLEGGTINTGDLGSGTQVNALQILETVGITEDDFDEQNTGFSAAADQLRDGDIDAAFIVGGWPVGAVEELATTADIEIVEVTDDTRDDVLEGAEWFAEDTIPGGTYDGVDEDVDTVSVQAMIATHEGVDEGVVEEVTEAIFENSDDLSIKAEFIELETALDGMSIELHPGAEAYFEESDLDLDAELEDDGEDEDEGEDEDDDE